MYERELFQSSSCWGLSFYVRQPDKNEFNWFCLNLLFVVDVLAALDATALSKFLRHCIHSNNLTNALESRAKMTSFNFHPLNFLCVHIFISCMKYNASLIFIEYTNVCHIHQLHTFNQSSVFSKWCYTHHNMKRAKIFHFQWQNAHSILPFHVRCSSVFLLFARAFSSIYSEKSQNDIHSGFYLESFCMIFS